jgi:hypothetical protein
MKLIIVTLLLLIHGCAYADSDILEEPKYYIIEEGKFKPIPFEKEADLLKLSTEDKKLAFAIIEAHRAVGTALPPSETSFVSYFSMLMQFYKNERKLNKDFQYVKSEFPRENWEDFVDYMVDDMEIRWGRRGLSSLSAKQWRYVVEIFMNQ